MLSNRPQGLDCTWPRLGSASQVCFENSPALRTLTTSTFKSEEEDEKGSLPACPSWVVSALSSYLYRLCTMCVNPSMPEVVSTANLLPYRRWRVTKQIWPRGSSREGTLASPGKPPCTVAQPRAQGAILEPRTFTYRPACLPNQVARYPMG